MKISLNYLKVNDVYRQLNNYVIQHNLKQHSYWVYDTATNIFDTTSFDQLYGSGIAARLIHGLRKQAVKKLPKNDTARNELQNEIERSEQMFTSRHFGFHKENYREHEDHRHYNPNPSFN